MKLLELLVKERIEWPADLEKVCQGYDRQIERVDEDGDSFSTDLYLETLSENYRERSKSVDECDAEVVTKEQYDNACKLVDDGYTLWFGGECPVNHDTLVDLAFDDNADIDSAQLAFHYDWKNQSAPNIIAYKVVKPVLISTHKHDASLEQFYAQGWTDDQLIEHGYAKVAEPGEMEPFRPGLSCEVVPGIPLGVREPIGFNCRCGSVPVVTEYPAHTFLEKGVQHMKDRSAQRDSAEGERSMAACVNAFNAMFGKDLTETQGWQFMVLLKMARSRNKFNPDDYEDGAAYTGLAGEAHSHE